MSTILDAVKRGYAYVVQNERGHFFSEGNYDILGPPRTDGDDVISWIAEQPWSNGKVGLVGCSSTAEWQMGVAAAGNPAPGGHQPPGLRRRRGPGGRLVRAGQLVPRRRGADALHRVDLRRAEPGAAHVPGGYVTGRPDPRVQVLRPGTAAASRGLVPGAAPPPGDGHHQGRGRPPGDLRRLHARGHRRRHDPAHARRPGVVQGRALQRQHALQRPRPLVHVVVRRLHRAEPGHVQPRAEGGEPRGRRRAVRHHRAYPALLVHPRHGEHGGRRARRGRCPLGLLVPHLWVVRPLPPGQERRTSRYAAEGPLLHHGPEPMADLRHLAPRGRPGPGLLPGQWRPRQLGGRGRRAYAQGARAGTRPMGSRTIP